MSDSLQDKPVHTLRQNQAIVQISLPLPPPDLLEKYNKIGLMEKTIELIENQALHRQKLEIHQINLQAQQLESHIEHQKNRDKETTRGQIFAFIIAIIAIIGGIIVAIMGYEIAASIISAIGLTGLVARFISGRKEP